MERPLARSTRGEGGQRVITRTEVMTLQFQSVGRNSPKLIEFHGEVFHRSYRCACVFRIGG